MLHSTVEPFNIGPSFRVLEVAKSRLFLARSDRSEDQSTGSYSGPGLVNWTGRATSGLGLGAGPGQNARSYVHRVHWMN
jgi:hypothetical protein